MSPATGDRFAVSRLIADVVNTQASKRGPVRLDLRQEDKLDPVGDVAPLLVGQVLPRAEGGSAGCPQMPRDYSSGFLDVNLTKIDLF